MIIVAGQMTMDVAILPDMVPAIAAMRDTVLGEAGCFHYSLLVEDPAQGIVAVFERWEDDAALATHLMQPWIVDFLGRFGGHLRETTVCIYDVGGIRPLAAVMAASA